MTDGSRRISSNMTSLMALGQGNLAAHAASPGQIRARVGDAGKDVGVNLLLRWVIGSERIVDGGLGLVLNLGIHRGEVVGAGDAFLGQPLAEN